jgi:hypothetical protein
MFPFIGHSRNTLYALWRHRSTVVKPSISLIDVIVILCRVTIPVLIYRHTNYTGRNVQKTATDRNARSGNEFESIKWSEF